MQRLLAVLLVVASGALAYWPTLGNGFLNLDDRVFIVDNPRIPGGLTWDSLKWAFTADVLEDTESVDYWQPATLVSRLIDGSLHGLNPAGHHLTNLLLHLANAALLLLLLSAATGRLWRSTVVALVFATHPLHVSSVAWVAERKDVLSGFFSLLTLAAFARFAAAYQAHLAGGAAGRTGGRVVRWYLLLAAGYALCLMSKPMTLPLPLVMLLVAVWPIPRERRPSLAQLAPCLAPLLLLAAGAVFLYTRVHTGSAELDQFADHSPLFIAGRLVTSLAAYPVRLLHPVGLQHIYSVHPDAVSAAAVAGSLLLLGAVTGVAAAGAKRRPFLAVGWLWYLVSLLPAATAFLTSAAADRFSYVPAIGVTTMIVWGVSEAAGGRLLAVRAIAAAAIVAALTVTTRAESRYWKDSVTLCTRLLALDPRHDVALRNLAVTLAEARQDEKALELFMAALAARPDLSASHHNVAVELENLGRLDEALQYFGQARALDPNAYWTHQSMGLIYLRQGRLDDALASFEEALRVRPRAAGTLREIGHVHSLRGRPALAADYYRRALELDPGNALLMREQGAELLKLGQPGAAASLFQRALEREPGNMAHLNNLGVAAAAQGDLSRAEAIFRSVLAGDPGNRFALEKLRDLGAASGGAGTRGPNPR